VAVVHLSLIDYEPVLKRLIDSKTGEHVGYGADCKACRWACITDHVRPAKEWAEQHRCRRSLVTIGSS
jgi:hypothetical protein